MTLHSINFPIQPFLLLNWMGAVWSVVQPVSLKIRVAFVSSAMKVVRSVMHSIFARIVPWTELKLPINFIISSTFNVNLTVVSAFTLMKQITTITSVEVVQAIALTAIMLENVQNVSTTII